jgi:hypothetical protein
MYSRWNERAFLRNFTGSFEKNVNLCKTFTKNFVASLLKIPLQLRQKARPFHR